MTASSGAGSRRARTGALLAVLTGSAAACGGTPVPEAPIPVASAPVPSPDPSPRVTFIAQYPRAAAVVAELRVTSPQNPDLRLAVELPLPVGADPVTLASQTFPGPSDLHLTYRQQGGEAPAPSCSGTVTLEQDPLAGPVTVFIDVRAGDDACLTVGQSIP